MDGKYLVYRVYTRKERPDYDDRSRFYGWSKSKAVIKAFSEQRNRKKYKIFKMNKEEIVKTLSEDIDDADAMIDILTLKSVKTGEEMYLFTTNNELRECEKKIQRMILDQASLENIEGDGNYLEMFINLDEYYADALYIIGYRPREVDILFPSADYHDDPSDITKVEEVIDDAYDGVAAFPQEVYGCQPNRLLGLSTLDDPTNKIFYSIESFIKVLRDDL